MTEKNILVPIDFSEVSKPLVRIADAWAQRSGATLYFLYAVPNITDRFIDPKVQNVFQTNDEIITDEIRQRLDEFVSAQETASPREYLVREGKAYLEILKAQKSYNIDLIIMAAHDHTTVDRLFVGSNTDYVLHHVHCPVYVYKEVVT